MPGSLLTRIPQTLGWFGVLALGLVAVELTARVEDWVQHRVPPTSPYNSTGQLVTRSRDGMHGRRNAAFQKWHMNNLGFRGPAVDSARTPGRLRVIAVGASETFGLYESPGKEWPRQLEDSLTRRLAGTACAPAGVEVWNAAFAGMTLPTIVQDLNLRLTRYSPDVVVLYPTPAFYLTGDRPEAPRPDSTAGQDVSGFRLRIWPRLRDQLKELTPTPVATMLRQRMISRAQASAGYTITDVPAERLGWYKEDLADVLAGIRGIGAAPVVATHANYWFGAERPPRPDLMVAWQRFQPLASADALIGFEAAARDATVEVAAGADVPVADVATALGREASAGFADFFHFDDQGAALAAGAFADAVGRALAGRCQ